MTVLTLLAVLLVGQPDRPDEYAHIPDLPGTLPLLAAPDAPPSPEAPSGDPASSGSGVPPSPGPEDQIAEHWLELARCESGNWHAGGVSFEGPIRWDWGAPGMQLPPWGTNLHHGGLQHAPSTWEWVAGDLGLLDEFPHAYDAPPQVQVEVATEVQRRQGWQAWPVCSRKVGLR